MRINATPIDLSRKYIMVPEFIHDNIEFIEQWAPANEGDFDRFSRELETNSAVSQMANAFLKNLDYEASQEIELWLDNTELKDELSAKVYFLMMYFDQCGMLETFQTPDNKLVAGIKSKRFSDRMHACREIGEGGLKDGISSELLVALESTERDSRVKVWLYFAMICCGIDVENSMRNLGNLLREDDASEVFFESLEAVRTLSRIWIGRIPHVVTEELFRVLWKESTEDHTVVDVYWVLKDIVAESDNQSFRDELRRFVESRRGRALRRQMENSRFD